MAVSYLYMSSSAVPSGAPCCPTCQYSVTILDFFCPKCGSFVTLSLSSSKGSTSDYGSSALYRPWQLPPKGLSSSKRRHQGSTVPLAPLNIKEACSDIPSRPLKKTLNPPLKSNKKTAVSKSSPEPVAPTTGPTYSPSPFTYSRLLLMGDNEEVNYSMYPLSVHPAHWLPFARATIHTSLVKKQIRPESPSSLSITSLSAEKPLHATENLLRIALHLDPHALPRKEFQQYWSLKKGKEFSTVALLAPMNVHLLLSREFPWFDIHKVIEVFFPVENIMPCSVISIIIVCLI